MKTELTNALRRLKKITACRYAAFFVTYGVYVPMLMLVLLPLLIFVGFKNATYEVWHSALYEYSQAKIIWRHRKRILGDKP